MLDGADDPLGDELRARDEPVERARAAVRCGKPGVSTSPGLTVCTEIPFRPSSTAIEREKASCACFEAEYGPTATSPAIETTLTRCEPAPRPGRNARRHQTEPR